MARGLRKRKKPRRKLDTRWKILAAITSACSIFFTSLLSTKLSQYTVISRVEEDSVPKPNIILRAGDDVKSLSPPPGDDGHAKLDHKILPSQICDSSPCIGQFRYSGPNESENSTNVLKQAIASYTYGNAPQSIFVPNHDSSLPSECIQEWKDNQPSKALNGMSANREDLSVFEVFFDDPKLWNADHIYMEIGAHDGVRESNSRFYDVCLGWKGILVEPHPSNFEKLEKLRPSAHHLQMAPSCPSGQVVMFPAHGYTNGQINDNGSTLEIHCGPLSHYLNVLGIRHIDFWSLDVEGSELDVLRTVDFEMVQIDVIISENWNRLPDTPKKAADVRSYLRQQGYAVISNSFVSKSDVFVHHKVCSKYGFPECNDIKKTGMSSELDDKQLCKSSPCLGQFKYSGPDISGKAMETQKEASKNYPFGIFIPSYDSSSANECIQEWRDNQPTRARLGMSANGEDLRVFEAFFQDPEFLSGDHMYLEIGAHDGVRESNTRFFDVCLGWKGMLVEPHPGNFARLEKLRPTAHHLQMASSCPSGQVVLFPAHGFPNGKVDAADSTLEIHCGPLSHYLDALEIRHIDFWSLDVVGSELDVLRTVDFEVVQIDVIISERYDGLPDTTKKAAEVRSYLQQQGYAVMRNDFVSKSDVFVHHKVCSKYGFSECAAISVEDSHLTVSICDSSPCDGFFKYSEPNRSRDASIIFNSARENYNYIIETGSHLIFMPLHNSSAPTQCVEEWNQNRPQYSSKGMSRKAEDIAVYNAFFNKPQFWGSNHTYMEIGAHDGVRESNSRFFDICLGWGGILVEPHPKNFEKMEKLRPTAHHLGLAPSCPSGEVIMFPVDEPTSSRIGGERSTLEIHCGPLSHYLKALEIKHIDFWSLDVEGSELKILQTVDFDRVQIDVIISESNNRLEDTAKNAAEVRSFLQQKGYLVLFSVVVSDSDVFLDKRVCHKYDFPECKSALL